MSKFTYRELEYVSKYRSTLVEWIVIVSHSMLYDLSRLFLFRRTHWGWTLFSWRQRHVAILLHYSPIDALRFFMVLSDAAILSVPKAYEVCKQRITLGSRLGSYISLLSATALLICLLVCLFACDILSLYQWFGDEYRCHQFS
jgi:hypothetical protein